MAVFFNSEINRRSANEDSFCDLKMRINHEAAVHVMAVADGMGGLSGGKLYSSEAIRLLNENLLNLIMEDTFKGSSLHEQIEMLTDFCREIFQQINQNLYTRGLNAGIKGGTTLSLVIRFWHSFIIANCGDSPVYIWKDLPLLQEKEEDQGEQDKDQGQSLRLACDIQNAAWHMVLEGRTREGSLLYYQNRSRLLQYLGRKEPVKPFIQVLTDEEADRILLGTDGAFGDLSRDRIGQLFTDHPEGQGLLADLFESAGSSGEEDNQTAILYVRTEGAGMKKKGSRKDWREEQTGRIDEQIYHQEDRQKDLSETLHAMSGGAMPGNYRKVGSRLMAIRERLYFISKRRK